MTFESLFRNDETEDHRYEQKKAGLTQQQQLQHKGRPTKSHLRGYGIDSFRVLDFTFFLSFSFFPLSLSLIRFQGGSSQQVIQKLFFNFIQLSCLGQIRFKKNRIEKLRSWVLIPCTGRFLSMTKSFILSTQNKLQSK